MERNTTKAWDAKINPRITWKPVKQNEDIRKEIEVNQKILEVLESIKSLENMDKEFTKDAEYHCKELRKILINKIVKYEYSDFYVKSKKRKIELTRKFAI